MTETIDIAARLADLETQLTGLPSEEIFQRELDANRHSRAHLEARIETIRFASHTLASLAPQIAAETKWLTELTKWRQTLSDELLASSPRPQTDLERGRILNLQFSVQVLDRGLGAIADTGWALTTLRLGQLMREAGYVEEPRIENQVSGAMPWFGSLPEVERRLKALQQQRDDAQARLDAVLLSEAVPT